MLTPDSFAPFITPQFNTDALFPVALKPQKATEPPVSAAIAVLLTIYTVAPPPVSVWLAFVTFNAVGLFELLPLTCVPFVTSNFIIGALVPMPTFPPFK